MKWKQSPHVCFTYYELAHIETFRSPGACENVVVEAIDRRTLEREAGQIEKILIDAGTAAVDIGCYDLGFRLSAPR